jgi:hypothetical protein
MIMAHDRKPFGFSKIGVYQMFCHSGKKEKNSCSGLTMVSLTQADKNQVHIPPYFSKELSTKWKFNFPICLI